MENKEITINDLSNSVNKFANIVTDLTRTVNKLAETVNNLVLSTKEAFDAVDKRFDAVDDELAKRPTKTEIFNWADKRIHNIELEVDRAKYIHADEWNKLPPQGDISRKLVEKGLK
ncbi:MAG: hypothetical protein ABIE43_05120 [Patescibacteria group bacterium]